MTDLRKALLEAGLVSKDAVALIEYEQATVHTLEIHESRGCFWTPEGRHKFALDLAREAMQRGIKLREVGSFVLESIRVAKADALAKDPNCRTTRGYGNE